MQKIDRKLQISEIVVTRELVRGDESGRTKPSRSTRRCCSEECRLKAGELGNGGYP
jgi:hypothetical protein